MCSRYYIDEEIEKVIAEFAGIAPREISPVKKGDIRPSEEALVLTGEKRPFAVRTMRWGFPQYERKGLTINARAETVLEKRLFRDSVLHRRCIIPAKHFYEWDSGKNKVTFFQDGEAALYMAGFYNYFQGEDRFVVLTVPANASVNRVHDRMPLILQEEELKSWIYDGSFLEFVLRKTPAQLKRYQEYEQQSLFLTEMEDRI
ncbi:MAG: SOS response-associated peptidase family protein [Lachnospiraceae bacterium]|nr:SOS response-associated peptidase family protein [Lachnospiraceae bacterium]